MTYCKDAPQMEKMLDKHGIQELYHFTAVDNLQLIAKCGGLWSKERLEEAVLLDTIMTGGNELSLDLDRDHGNWDKVHLYFCPNTPMAYRVQQNPEGRDSQSAHICYLTIDHRVSLWNGVFFTDTNATKIRDGHQRDQGLAGLKLVHLPTIRAHLDGIQVPKQQWHRNVQAECLVPGAIPLEHVKAISFISEASLKEGERIWGRTAHPPFVVNRKLFHRGFPSVRNFLLTAAKVTKKNYDSEGFGDTRVFLQGKNPSATLLVNLYATAGTQASVIWTDANADELLRDRAEFERESAYWHWSSMGIADVDEGNFTVDYYIGGIRWFRVQFEVR